MARVAGIMAAKRTPDLIPLCHPLPLTSVEVDFELGTRGVAIRARVRVTGQTGVEMEALTAAAVAGLTLIDMTKGVERGRLPRVGPAAREVGRAIRHVEATGRQVNTAHVITISDGASHGKRDDKSGPALVGILDANQFEVSGPEVVPDERDRIAAAITKASDGGSDLVITTGGTGLGPRDVTPQATASVIDYEVPGLTELMRRAGAAKHADGGALPRRSPACAARRW